MDEIECTGVRVYVCVRENIYLEKLRAHCRFANLILQRRNLPCEGRVMCVCVRAHAQECAGMYGNFFEKKHT